MVKRQRIAEFIREWAWLLKMLLSGHFTTVAVHVLEPRGMRLLPSGVRDWLYSRWEWTTCREFNDGPDGCYLTWQEFWKLRRSGK